MNNGVRVLQMLLVCAGLYLAIAPINHWPLVIWDEARLAQSTIEMLESGNYGVPTVDGKADLWSTKPPLVIWIQCLSSWLFGVGEFAIRFPSALAFAGVLFLLVYYSKKLFANSSAAVFALLVIISCSGVFGLHTFNSGDYDAVLCFFTSWFVFSFAWYLKSPNIKNLIPVFLALALGALTKGIVIFIFVPVSILYLFFSRKQVSFKQVILIFCLAILPFIAYLFYREFLQAGFIQAVWKNDAGGRFQTALSDMRAPFIYYLELLWTKRAGFWFGLFLVLLPVSFFLKSKELAFLILQFFFFLFIISSAQTKAFWYDLPLYPLMAMVLAYFLSHAWDGLSRTLRIGLISGIAIPFCILWFQSVEQMNAPVPKGMEMENLLKMMAEKKVSSEDFMVFNPAYAPQVNFYTYCLQKQKRAIKRTELPLKEIPASLLLYKRDVPVLLKYHRNLKVLRDHSQLVLVEVK